MYPLYLRISFTWGTTPAQPNNGALQLMNYAVQCLKHLTVPSIWSLFTEHFSNILNFHKPFDSETPVYTVLYSDGNPLNLCTAVLHIICFKK